MTFLECKNLTKRFGSISIFKNLDLRVEEKNILLVGANGLGKSTLIKMMFGLQKPTEGAIRILGLDPAKDENKVRENISYLPPEPTFPPYFSVDNLREYYASFSSLNDIERIEDLLGVLDLRKKYTKTLSSGEKQLLSMVLNFSLKRKAYLMDEAISSIDPLRRLRAVTFLSHFDGKLFITTHEMTELIAITDTILRIFRKSNEDFSSFEERDVFQLPLLISSKNPEQAFKAIRNLGIDITMEGPLLKTRVKIRDALDIIGDNLLFAKRDFNE